MDTIVQTAALRERLAVCRQQRIALVPTMGNLHAGHLALVARAQCVADIVVVSIFVNPLQFGENEDLAQYPRTLSADQAALVAAGVDFLFTPGVAELYPRPLAEQTQVLVPGISEQFCGASRPGHFAGVATVVCKLLNIVQPDIALFGRKDYQQLHIIRQMVADLALPVQIQSVPTVREPDGLALSSRNQYLSPVERVIAPRLYQQLQHVAEQVGQVPVSRLTADLAEQLNAAGFRTDYVHLVDADSLGSLQSGSKRAVILVAAWLGRTRLIDNVVVSLFPSQSEED
ncbi:MAG: pantoate--beta-alanine ligase [Pseudomonadota bacterium]